MEVDTQSWIEKVSKLEEEELRVSLNMDLNYNLTKIVKAYA